VDSIRLMTLREAMIHRRGKARVTFVAALIAAMLSTVVGPAGTTFAHTSLVSSSPADGDVVAEPVSEIELVFSESVEPVANGFEVFMPDASIVRVQPVTDDGITCRLEFDPPLGTGDVGVKYEVISADGHPVGGSFSFAIELPATPPP